ncbi:MAG: hypothetical protein HOC70_00015 [Gammaproteobacteria bacterium]|jgi:hypothetical protein|nr:hypothetical protein [Gammaproteobacteria bacterium]MBT4491596.1 hypothetical protein [Gammaproteobacteria bacterium]MBT7370479.1 hypothetical protein [Gammaproteobacteria bacterium]
MEIVNQTTKVTLGLWILLSVGCTTTPVNPAELIIGTWQSELAGFTLVSSYSATDVSVDGHDGVSYTLDGDRLAVGGDVASVRIVSFPAANEMVQLDPLTQTAHRYVRTGN